MKGASVLLVTATFLAGCATSSNGAVIEAPYLHPALAHPSGPFSTRYMPPPTLKPRSGRPPKTMPRRNAQAPNTLPLSISADLEGQRRAEVLQSARRVLGIKGSFDDRSFLGHVLRVNDLLPDGFVASSLTPAEYKRFAERQGMTVVVSKAMPGDVVLFRCKKGCGPGTSDGLGAGIIFRVHSESLEFIAYVEGVVRECHSGNGIRPRKPSYRVDEVVSVVSIIPPQGRNGQQ